ncbi:MAG: hypothetical protein O4965_12245, partial [Trichodesmium sp. St19_bin1]|nr:hypothetical protein [Trichodesmium sp. St19_bin1]
DRGFLDSQIAVVGYNDPSTNTFLSFTEQPKIEDRKNAAIKAINSISVGGGGDHEEAVNAGLIRALSGGAGKWREEADIRRIILFGDAPPKDTELRSQVLELATNVGVNISNRKALSITGDIETSSITNDLSITRFALETENSGGTTVATPVEIFSVLIGNDSSTEADFQSLADATGGELFNADNASQVVDVLIEAIQTPIVPNISIENTTGPVMEGDEGTTNAIFTVNLSVPSEETIEIGYDTDPSIIRTTVFRPNEAINGEDYKDTSGVLKFNPGEITKTFTVPIIGDTKRELDDLLTVYLVDSNSIDKKITFNTKILSSTRLTIKNDDTGFSKQSFDIIENSKNGTVIGNLNVNNHWVFEYAEMPQLTFKITNNVDPDNDGNSAFSLDGDRLIVNDSDDLDYETNPILNISIEASDGELTNEATVTINLTDVDDNGETDGTFAPSQIAYSNNFTVNKGGWVSQDKYPRHVADVNGDGRDDIVSFGYNEVSVSLKDNIGLDRVREVWNN